MKPKLLVMLALLALAACSKQDVGTTATTAASGQRPAIGVDEIRQALLQQYPKAAIAINAMQIDTTGGKVTLRGTVNDEQTKKMLSDSVRQIPGIGEVNDELRVVGP